ncbi:MAG: hypothetical protein AAB375_02615 [Patescibacteria group bacterium]
MAKNDKALVEGRLEELIRESERLARVYVLMVHNGGRVDTIKSADEYCRQLIRARVQVTVVYTAVREHYELGHCYGFLTESLAEYIRRVCEKMGSAV